MEHGILGAYRGGSSGVFSGVRGGRYDRFGGWVRVQWVHPLKAGIGEHGNGRNVACFVWVRGYRGSESKKERRSPPCVGKFVDCCFQGVYPTYPCTHDDLASILRVLWVQICTRFFGGFARPSEDVKSGSFLDVKSRPQIVMGSLSCSGRPKIIVSSSPKIIVAGDHRRGRSSSREIIVFGSADTRQGRWR